MTNGVAAKRSKIKGRLVYKRKKNSLLAFKIIGIRTVEKIHAEMISRYESLNTVDLKECYVILYHSNFNLYKNYKFLEPDFSYRSDNNKTFLNMHQL